MFFFFGCGREPGSSADRSAADPLFQEAGADTRLDFEHFIGATGSYYLPEIMGSGVALLDYDVDGDLDVHLVQGNLLNSTKTLDEARFPPPEQHWPGNRLFRNELIPKGRLSFTDVTEQAGVGHQGYGMGAAVGDFDNDADPDLYVTNFGPNALYQNNGDGTFTEVARQTQTDDARWSMSAAFVDYDRDGNLDLFVANYVDFTIRNNKDCYDAAGARDYCTPTIYRPVPDRLFRNEGRGKFVDVSAAVGLGSSFGNGLGVTCADFDGDGWIDIYVANDGNANQLWRNNGDGTFEDVALMSGTAFNAEGQAEAGMGVTAGDFDGDGDEDLFTTHLAQETNTLYLNNGRGEFRDATNRFGLGSASVRFTGFGSAWFDYDHDGWLDLFIANGAVTIVEALRGSHYPFQQKNLLFRGHGDERFENVSGYGGLDFDLSEVSRGAAFGDVDNDGDIDIVVSNNNGPARLLLNQAATEASSLLVRLNGEQNNREGIGARVVLFRGDQPPLWRRAHRDGSYLSSSDLRVHFGLGANSTPDAIGVIWPNGRREIWKNIRAEREITLREGTGESWEASP